MNSFIPLKEANLAIVDGRISQEIENNLEKLNIKIIKTTECKDVHPSIAYHPDIVIHPINHTSLVIAPNVYEYYEDKLKYLGIKLIKGESYLGNKYPLDVGYNVGRVGNYAIHNFKYTDQVLKFHLKKEGLDLVDVNQGYGKCSLGLVNENTVITSDRGIYKRLKDLPISILLIDPGHIILDHQKYGLIGGINGNLSNTKSILSGSLVDHPNGQVIIDFFKNNGSEVIYLSDKPAIDLGTIITLYVK